MNRSHFLKSLLSFGLLSIWGNQIAGGKTRPIAAKDTRLDQGLESMALLRQKLKEAWSRSEIMTMTNVKQMPPEFFTFKYTNEAMTFAEQWRHCVVYTCGQIAGRTGLKNPYENVKLPVQMTKDHVIKELEKMYMFVRQSIEGLPDEKLLSPCDFAGDSIPTWRLFYAMENHIIHHRGQCVVYLRLNGVVPKGYYGW